MFCGVLIIFHTESFKIHMNIKKILHPDAADIAAAPSKTKKSPKSYDAHAMADAVNVNQKISTSWAANPAITLLWTTQPDSDKLVNDFASAVGKQGSNASLSPSESQVLKQMDVQMNDAVRMQSAALIINLEMMRRHNMRGMAL